MHTHTHAGLKSWSTACVWILEEPRLFPRNLWHKSPLSYYLMTKHSRLLLQLCFKHTSTEKPLVVLGLESSAHLCYWPKSTKSDDSKSSPWTRQEPEWSFPVFKQQPLASIVLFVSLKHNMSISIMKAPLCKTLEFNTQAPKVRNEKGWKEENTYWQIFTTHRVLSSHFWFGTHRSK